MIGGLGVQELLIVFVIALVLFGGKKLPEVGQNLGKALRSFKAAEEETRKDLEGALKDSPASEEEAGRDKESAKNGDAGKKAQQEKVQE